MSIDNLFNPEILILLGFLFIGGVLLLFLISRNFTAGIYLWLLAVLFFKYNRITIEGSMLPDFSIDRMLFVMLMFIFAAEALVRKRRIFSFTAIEYSMFLFCAFAVMSMIYSGFIIKEGGRLRIGELLTGFILPFFMFFAAKNTYDTYEKREGFIKFMIAVGLYLSFTAVFEHFRIEQLVFPKFILDPGFGIHMGRARGPFGQAAVNGTVLGFALASSAYFTFNYRRSRLWRFFSFALLVLTPAAIFFTYTRAAWLGALAGFAIIMTVGLKEKQKAAAIVLTLLCIAVVLGASFFMDTSSAELALDRTRDQSPVYDRLNLYIASINMFASSPLSGVGFGKFSDNAPDYFENVSGIPYQDSEIKQHDTFTAVLAEMGLAGISLILCIFISILSKSIKLYRRLSVSNSAERRLVVIFWGFMAVYIVNSVFIEMRYFEFVNAIFFVFAGLICRREMEYADKAY